MYETKLVVTDEYALRLMEDRVLLSGLFADWAKGSKGLAVSDSDGAVPHGRFRRAKLLLSWPDDEPGTDRTEDAAAIGRVIAETLGSPVRSIERVVRQEGVWVEPERTAEDGDVEDGTAPGLVDI